MLIKLLNQSIHYPLYSKFFKKMIFFMPFTTHRNLIIIFLNESLGATIRVIII